MTPHLKINTKHSDEENYNAFIKKPQSYQSKIHTCYRTQNLIFQMLTPCHILFRFFPFYNLSYSNVSSLISYKVLNPTCVFISLGLRFVIPPFLQTWVFSELSITKALGSGSFTNYELKNRNLPFEELVPKLSS